VLPGWTGKLLRELICLTARHIGQGDPPAAFIPIIIFAGRYVDEAFGVAAG